MSGVRRKTGILGMVAGLALVLAARGGKSAPASGGGYGAGYGAGAGKGTGKAGSLTTRSISGLGTVLQAPTGYTLYHLTTETNGQIGCTGSCATTWPPLIASSGKVPAASPDLAGHLGTVKRPDATVQVTFDGAALYTFSGDSGPGQANGQGVGGVWFAVTASGVSPSDSSSPGY